MEEGFEPAAASGAAALPSDAKGDPDADTAARLSTTAVELRAAASARSRSCCCAFSAEYSDGRSSGGPGRRRMYSRKSTTRSSFWPEVKSDENNNTKTKREKKKSAHRAQFVTAWGFNARRGAARHDALLSSFARVLSLLTFAVSHEMMGGATMFPVMTLSSLRTWSAPGKAPSSTT